MIVKDNFTINGKPFVRTYSDKGMMIEREGVQYSVAEDLAEFGRDYTETDTPVEDVDNDEATEEDYIAALAELGVEE